MIGRFPSDKFGRMSPPQLLILMMVRNERKYGYEILKELREIFEGMWEPKTGMVYPLLKKMQESGLLDSEMIGDREYYGLTDEGRETLMEMLPKIGFMISMATRFMVLVNKTVEEFGIELMDISEMHDHSEINVAHLLDVRDHLRSELEKIEEMIEKQKEE